VGNEQRTTVLVGKVPRYNLTQLSAVLQQAAWSGDSLPINKVTKRMDLVRYMHVHTYNLYMYIYNKCLWLCFNPLQVAYNSLLDALSQSSPDQVPEIPSRLPGLKRSSFLASHNQLNSLVSPRGN